jgi:hypothetical protein
MLKNHYFAAAFFSAKLSLLDTLFFENGRISLTINGFLLFTLHESSVWSI